MNNYPPPPPQEPESLPKKIAAILARVSNALVSVSRSRSCDNDEALSLTNASKFLDKLTASNASASDEEISIIDAADAIMALPSELRIMAEGGEDSAPTKRVRLSAGDPSAHVPDADSMPHAVNDPYATIPIDVSSPLPSDPSLSSDPPSAALSPPSSVGLSPSEVAGSQNSVCPPDVVPHPKQRLKGKQVVSVNSPNIVTSCQSQKSVATLCSHFELSPRGASGKDTQDFDPRTGNPFVSLGDDGVVSESLSSMDDEQTAPSDVVRPVPNVKAAAALKPTTPVSLSRTQKRNLDKKHKKLKEAAAAGT